MWVIWLGNYWWLFGLVIVYDLYISKKVKWAFWRKRYKEGEKPNVWLDWLDAIIYAVAVVLFINIFFFQAYMIPSSSMEKSLMTGDYLFVSKVAYGPKVVETPISLPFVHNVLPISGKESYVEWIKIPYRRLKGFSDVKKGDKVVFGFPHGDTVLTKAPSDDYYREVRTKGREYAIRQYGPVVVRPNDKKDNYVKRCLAVAGDTLQIVDGFVYVNGIKEEMYKGIQITYTVVTNGTTINSRILNNLDVNPEEFYYDNKLPGYPYLPLTNEAMEEISKLPNIVSITPNLDVYPPDFPDSPLTIFPFTHDFKWTRDNYGPLWIPSKGSTVKLDITSLPLYARIIEVYEKNRLEVRDSLIFINDIQTDQYTFTQDYFFMLGDNRHNSLDSRYWGFVPEDHIIGKPRVIWFSSDRNKSFPKNIRWKRILKFV